MTTKTASRPDRIAPRAIVPLACGCEAQDAGWYGRLVLTGRAFCPEAAALHGDLRAAARAQAACGNPPADEHKAAFRAAQADSTAAQSALTAHVERNRPAAS